MPKVEERVDHLEEMMMKLAYAQMNTQVEIQNLSKEMGEFKNEMKEFKNEMKEFKNEMKEFKNKVDLDIDNLRQDTKKRNKEWANLAHKMGTVVEDIVVPNIPFIAKKYFGLENYNDFMIRRQKKKPLDKSSKKEFDIIVVYDNKIVFNETKSTPRLEYADDFVNFIKEKTFYEYFPEYKKMEIIPIFASLYIPENILKHLSKNNIFVMGMKEDTMDLLNPGLKL